MNSISNFKSAKLCAIGVLDMMIQVPIDFPEFNIVDKMKDSDAVVKLLEYASQKNREVKIFSTDVLTNAILYIQRSSKQKADIDFLLLNQIKVWREFKHIIESQTKLQLSFNPLSNAKSQISVKAHIGESYEKIYKIDCENDVDNNEDEKNETWLMRLKHNFNSDIFFFCYQDIENFVQKSKNEFVLFLENILKKNPSIRICLILTPKGGSISTSGVDKDIIGLVDIICSPGGDPDFFLKFEKKRKNFNRTVITVDHLRKLKVVIQKNNLVISKNEYTINLTNEKKRILDKDFDFYYSVFLGGFLSRYIYSKTLLTCYNAGFLILNKMLNSVIYKHDINSDDYSVVVKKKRKPKKKITKMTIDCPKMGYGKSTSRLATLPSTVRNFNPNQTSSSSWTIYSTKSNYPKFSKTQNSSF